MNISRKHPFRTSLFEKIYNNFKGIKLILKFRTTKPAKISALTRRKFTVCKIVEINLKSKNRSSYNLKLAQYRKIQKRRPSIYKRIRFSMALHGNACQYMIIHGSTWAYMVIHGNRWRYMAVIGYTWQYMERQGNTWLYTWQYMVIHGNT